METESGYDPQGHSVDWGMDVYLSGMRIHIPKVDASPPMIASPLEPHSPLNLQNPFDGSVPTTTHQASYSPPIPPPTAPMTAPITTPSGATPPSQTAAQPPAISTSFPFPNPYDADGAAPTRFNHPYVPSLNDLSYDQEATDGSFFTAGGHSRENASAPFAPLPQFPNPYGAHDVTPAQFNHPNFPSPNNLSHNRETADGSFFTANGYSREYASAPFAPPQFPNPYGAHDVTPTQFNHPNFPSPNNLSHDRETTDGSFFTANGYSRKNAYAPFKPPQAPPSYS